MGASPKVVDPERGFACRSRVAASELAARIAATGAVVIEGPRGCAKTETARQAAASEVRLDVDDQARAAGRMAPTLLLGGDRPRLIDECQLVSGDLESGPARG